MEKQKDAFYFPHFCNARHDRKIKRVRKELGLEGYGIFFMLLEVLREQADFTYPMEDIDLLADEFGTSEQKIRTILCNYQLFEIDEEEKFFSGNLVMYLQPYLEGKEKKRISGIRGNLVRYKHITKEQSNEMSDVDILLLHNEIKETSQCESLAIPKRSQLNEIKVKEINENKVNILNDPLHKTFTINWFKNHNKLGKYQIVPTDKDYQYAFEACNKLGNDESLLDYTIKDYWDNYNETWYYQKSKRHIFSSFAANIENHLPTEEEKPSKKKKRDYVICECSIYYSIKEPACTICGKENPDYAN